MTADSLDESHPPLEVVLQQLNAALALLDATGVNLAYALLRIIDAARPEDRPAALQHIADHRDEVSSSKEIKFDEVVTAAESALLKQRYAQLVDGILDLILQGNPTAEDFYNEAYDLTQNPVFREFAARAFALHWILIDPRLPYFQLEDGLRMSNDDWNALRRKLRVQSAKIRFILNTDFEQNSEEADLLLRVLHSVDPGVQRVRLIGTILWQLRGDERRRAAALAEAYK